MESGGVYLVEDIDTTYWTVYRDQPMSFIDFSKWLIDAMLPMIDEPNFPRRSPRPAAGGKGAVGRHRCVVPGLPNRRGGSN